MCVPSPPEPAPQPTAVQSLPSATNFDLGAPQPGLLGRLALRLRGSTSSASPSSSAAAKAPVSISPALALGGSSTAAPQGTGQSGSQNTGAPFQNLRFGAGSGNAL